MTNQMNKDKYIKELKRLESSDINIEKKIKLIDNLYTLINMNYRNFIKNNWQIVIK